MAEQLGDGLLGVMREIKASFDPHNLFNPGKVVPDGRFKIDTDLRQGAGHELKLPFTPVLAFAAKDGSFTRNLEQCNGCGGCRKETPTMCPTFIATGEEIMSTRGRANAIRAALELRGLAGRRPAALRGAGSGAEQLPLLQSLHDRVPLERQPVPAQSRTAARADSARRLVLARAADQLGGLPGQARLPDAPAGQPGAGLALRAQHSDEDAGPRLAASPAPLRPAALRPLVRSAASARRLAPRGRVVLWDDTFVRYHEPQIGIAAVKVLEAAGFEVALPVGRKCCGRPAFSQGNLDEAMRLGQHNLALLNRDVDAAPILFLEPSCYSMFVEDYRELKLEGAERVARRCFLFEQFIEDLLAHEPEALQVQGQSRRTSSSTRIATPRR